MPRTPLLTLCTAVLLAPLWARAADPPPKPRPGEKADRAAPADKSARPEPQGATREGAKPASAGSAERPNRYDPSIGDAPAAPAPPPLPAAATQKSAPPPPPPKPAPELERIKFLAGTFNCEGTSPTSFGPDLTFKGRFVGKPGLGGFVIGYQYAETRVKERPFALAAEGNFAWDVGLKRYLIGWADNAGAMFLLRAEPPADVDRFVFKGTATASFGRHVPFQYTLTRNVNGFDLQIEGSDPDGTMLKLATLACARAR